MTELMIPSYDARRWLEAIRRRELKARHDEELDNARTRIAAQTELRSLAGRCRVGF